MKDPLILLTGGRGRIAREICRSLTMKGKVINCLSRTPGDGYLSLDDLFKSDLLEGCNCILHTAWSTMPLTSEKNPGIEWQIDLPFLAKMLKHVGECGAKDPPHFIFFSSGGTVYGNAVDNRPSTESDPTRPIGWHGLAKCHAEAVVAKACAHFGMPYTILRISNPYGMRIDSNKLQGIIPILAKYAVEGLRFKLWGDGSAQKDFIHISDLVEALNQIIDFQITGTYNLCSGESHKISALISLIEEIIGEKIDIEKNPKYPWDVSASLLDNRALKRKSGWSCKMNFQEGVRACVEEYLSLK